jgi:hypothetical protein
MRKLLWLVLLLVVLPGGALVGLALYAARRLPATVPVLLWSRVWSLVYWVPYELTAAVLHNEGATQLRPANAAESRVLGAREGAPVYPVGDLGAGVALGPGQVLRRNITRLWSSANALERLVAIPAEREPELLALPGYERAALWASLKVLKEALRDAGGDLHQAARRYNGRGEAAESYATRADAFRQTYRTNKHTPGGPT